MNRHEPSRESCACGRPLASPTTSQGEWVEVSCACGRRLDFQRLQGGWSFRAALMAEGSVPLDGFSRELRLRPDTERFWFHDIDGVGRRSPVHVVFSPSARIAEVKRGDVKPLQLSDISTPTEARRRWLAWTTRSEQLRPRKSPRVEG